MRSPEGSDLGCRYTQFSTIWAMSGSGHKSVFACMAVLRLPLLFLLTVFAYGKAQRGPPAAGRSARVQQQKRAGTQIGGRDVGPDLSSTNFSFSMIPRDPSAPSTDHSGRRRSHDRLPVNQSNETKFANKRPTAQSIPCRATIHRPRPDAILRSSVLEEPPNVTWKEASQRHAQRQLAYPRCPRLALPRD
ncbi:hypothetical protein K461DRAFT_46523 [Myriangium duriaei CBS 260.36]|uniref:Uncharacterized protein n=1 Tax=Myriangium duriaei CBS 260.36 TaxID=1168546 RepID=A0A9P4IZ49_9PEZI|nr:hypothetical protein K461DRAFT_46523 [Myriangium duriaei CBS 260.36]